MDVEAVPPALSARLGIEGTVGLLSLLEQIRREWTVHVNAFAEARFERRLAEECAALRLALTQTEATLRKELGEWGAGLQLDVHHEAATLRREINGLLRWSFVFWAGQVVATASIVGLMLKALL